MDSKASLASAAIDSQLIEVKKATSIVWAYDDKGTGASHDLSIWRADLSQDPGYYSLGDVAVQGYRAPKSINIVRADGDILAAPVDYQEVWNTQGARGHHKASLWAPIPPAGYVCLGHVVNISLEKPSTDRIRCVREDYAVEARSNFVWDDRKSKAKRDVTIVESLPLDSSAQGFHTFIAHPTHKPDASTRYHALALAKTFSPLKKRYEIIDEDVAKLFAPRIYFHKEETFFPSSVEFFLDHVDAEDEFMTTKEKIKCPSCTNLSFLNGQHPQQHDVPIYAQIVNRTQDGQATNVTDVIYWTFYPYNRGKRVCIGLHLGKIGCAGGYSTFGHHVGDWEHMTLRFEDGVPQKIALSTHNMRNRLSLDDINLEIVDGTHPVIYAAKGSHGLYPDVGEKRYKNLPNGHFLADHTSRESAWDSWQNVVTFAYQTPGTYEDSLSWLNLPQRWGNRKAGCGIAEKVAGECILNSGPTGPMQKGFAHPHAFELE